MVLEKALAYYSRAFDFLAIALRYFNAARALTVGDIGDGGAGLYIHVDDLAAAHVLALEALEQGGPTAAYNLGTGRGYSVLEVIKAAEKMTGKKVPYRVGPQRPGDPAVLVASAEKAMAELGWQPQYILV